VATAVADPANPSRERTIGIIHHHGNDASTVNSVDIRLRRIAFMGLLGVYTIGNIALALLLCRGSN
jgi:hypothetical protein